MIIRTRNGDELASRWMPHTDDYQAFEEALIAGEIDSERCITIRNSEGNQYLIPGKLITESVIEFQHSKFLRIVSKENE